MTVLSSLFSGISGLVANGSALSVIGDNIANVNTIGFKRGSASFENALTQKIANAQVGLGSRLSNVAVNFAQGTFETTSNVTDLAINGSGFFVVKAADGQFYTRAGNFFRDKDGKLVNPNGYVLQGYAVDSTTNTEEGTLSDIVISNETSAPVVTSEVVLKLNLDKDESIKGAWTLPADGASMTAATAMSNCQTSCTVYDSLGTAHSVTVFFNKTAESTWEYHALVDAGELTGGTAGQTVVIESGTLTFNTADGTLNTHAVVAPTDGNPAGAPQAGRYYDRIQWKGAAEVLATNLNFDFGAGSVAPASGDGQITQYAQDFEIVANTANGRPAGRINSFEFNEDGYLVGQFTNGETRNLYRLALATFASEQNLQRNGGNLFAETADSGTANINFANTSGRGSIRGSQLEMSNVDLATEFVKMVITQRGFQASARTISTTDQLLAELVNLGR